MATSTNEVLGVAQGESAAKRSVERSFTTGTPLSLISLGDPTSGQWMDMSIGLNGLPKEYIDSSNNRIVYSHDTINNRLGFKLYDANGSLVQSDSVHFVYSDFAARMGTEPISTSDALWAAGMTINLIQCGGIIAAATLVATPVAGVVAAVWCGSSFILDAVAKTPEAQGMKWIQATSGAVDELDCGKNVLRLGSCLIAMSNATTGNDSSGATTAPTPTPKPKPTPNPDNFTSKSVNLNSLSSGRGTLTASWRVASDYNQDGNQWTAFNLYYQEGGSASTRSNKIALWRGKHSYTITGLKDNTHYCVGVTQVKKETGESNLGRQKCATTDPEPAPATSFTISGHARYSNSTVPNTSVFLDFCPDSNCNTFTTPFSTTSAADGSYSFASLTPGWYRVVYTAPTGWLGWPIVGGYIVSISGANVTQDLWLAKFLLSSTPANNATGVSIAGSTIGNITWTVPAEAVSCDAQLWKSGTTTSVSVTGLTGPTFTWIAPTPLAPGWEQPVLYDWHVQCVDASGNVVVHDASLQFTTAP